MKQPEKMTRYELLKELAGYMHPLSYPFIKGYSTPMLGALVTYYRLGRAR